MPDVYKHIGEKIREFRTSFGGKGISQEMLAAAIGTTPNTISRWETAAYKPSAADLDKLARFFGISVDSFFPEFQEEDRRVKALLRATGDLGRADLDELIRYAQFRKARRRLKNVNKQKAK